jgi:hypothetical protein
MKKVPEQKGTIISNPPTMKQMPFKAKVAEARSENAMRKSAQTLGYRSPKGK